MKLAYLRMFPFAGAPDRMVTFADGINVLHGNNEAGKSTICKAIHHTLYTRSQLSKPEFRKKMERFIPVGKGDTARTELGFEHGGAHYRLCRSWGASRQSELWLPDGSCITNEDAIQAQVESFLGMKEGTFSALYYIDQEGLQAKLDAMKKDEDTMQTMGDFFMRLSMGAGGVSIQAFTDLVDAEIARTYSRWDSQFGMPQNSRGIDNPYKKEVGLILEHYYVLEGARRDHTLAQEAEKAIDAVNDKIRTLETRLSEFTTYLDEKRELYQRCVELESRRSSIAAARAKAETLRSVLKRWDEIDLFFVGCPASEGALQKRAEDIESERANRNAYDALRKKVEAITSVRALMKEKTDAAAALASGRYVSNADFDLYTQAHTRLATNRAVMESQQSAVTIRSNADATLGIRCDRGDAETLVIEKGTEAKRAAHGSIEVEVAGLDIRFTSGPEKMDALLAEMEGDVRTLEALHAKYGEEDLSGMKNSNGEFHSLEVKIMGLTRSIEKAHDSLDIDTMDEALRSFESLEEPRDATSIAKDAGRIEQERKEFDVRKRGYEGQRKELVEQYKDRTAVQVAITALGSEEATHQKAVDEMRALVGENADAFVLAYQETTKEHAVCQNELHEKKLERARIVEPERSSEELHAAVAEAQAAYDRAIRDGKALLRIRNAADALLSDAMTPFGAIGREMGATMAALTSGRYGSLVLDDFIPEGLCRADGEVLTFEKLSTGTKAVLVLDSCILLGSAYANGAGVFILDDSLVDLDPDRMAQAASFISKNAGDNQFLIMTCHPDVATLFERGTYLTM